MIQDHSGYGASKGPFLALTRVDIHQFLSCSTISVILHHDPDPVQVQGTQSKNQNVERPLQRIQKLEEGTAHKNKP